jgi:hypothetical protein
MAFLGIEKPEPREFKYKPRFYDQDAEQATGDRQTDFANKLHREWSSRRHHRTGDNKFAWLPIISIVFFALVLAFVFFKFFA